MEASQEFRQELSDSVKDDGLTTLELIVSKADEADEVQAIDDQEHRLKLERETEFPAIDPEVARQKRIDQRARAVGRMGYIGKNGKGL